MPATPPAPAATPTKPAATPSPYDDPLAYLKAHGWRPIGNPDWQDCLWEDPTKPLIDEEKKVPKFARTGNGKMEQVMAKDANLQVKAVEQTLFIPAGEPVPFQTALREQLNRDRQVLIEKRREEISAQRELEREEAEREQRNRRR